MRLCLPSVKGHQRRHARDHIPQPQSALHDILTVIFDLAECDTTLFLPDTVFEKFREYRGHRLAGVAVGGCPECEEGLARGGGEGEVGLEFVLAAYTCFISRVRDQSFWGRDIRGIDSVFRFLWWRC